MRILTLAYNEKNKLIGCSFSRNPKFHQLLKYRIKSSQRHYYSGDNSWYVKDVAIVQLVRFGKQCFDRVVYKDLPAHLQLKIAASKGNSLHKAVTEQDPYQVLHLQTSAPLEVIKAAYKALAHLHHPDKGGDQVTFTQINDAYVEICGEKEHATA